MTPTSAPWDATGRPHFGVNLLGQHATWSELREAVLRIDELGFDSVWTWDQLTPFTGNAAGPMLEGWQLLSAWAALTERVRLGTLVTGVTYRHPGVLAKMATTLDQVSGGRAILGIGAAFNAREHAMYGIPFPSDGQRLELLGEACEAIRLLMEQPVTTYHGRHVQLENATCEPKPVQRRLPMLVAGRGERKTLRIAARFADYWHYPGAGDDLPRLLDVLRAHCLEVGRDPSEITPLVTVRATTGEPPASAPSVVLRDNVAEVRAYLAEVAFRANVAAVPQASAVHTTEGLVLDLAAQWRAGARGFLFYIHPPFDLETVTQIARDVRPLVERKLGVLV
jgi:alkanesulfonate monooxygenase SsuD/methylene tetrahydromethanopterin reductase-like flavin-dependent oxidoreductase (luciferase family)